MKSRMGGQKTLPWRPTTTTTDTRKQTWQSCMVIDGVKSRDPCLRKIRESRWIRTLGTSFPSGMNLRLHSLWNPLPWKTCVDFPCTEWHHCGDVTPFRKWLRFQKLIILNLNLIIYMCVFPLPILAHTRLKKTSWPKRRDYTICCVLCAIPTLPCINIWLITPCGRIRDPVSIYWDYSIYTIDRDRTWRRILLLGFPTLR